MWGCGTIPTETGRHRGHQSCGWLAATPALDPSICQYPCFSPLGRTHALVYHPPLPSAPPPLQVTNNAPLRPLPAPLHPDAGGSDTQQPLDQSAPPQPATPAVLTIYEVTVVTGDKYGAGTDATVSALLTGTSGTAEHTFDQVGGRVGVGVACR